MNETVLIRDGACLRLFDTGGDGLPVVFQHGLGGSEGQVRQNFPDDAGIRRITLECRAQDGSEAGASRPFTLAMLAEDVLAAADAMGLPRFVAGGISTGAAIALRLAGLHPDRVSGLVLVRPSWAFDPAPANMRPFAEVGRLLRAHPPAEAKRLFQASETAAALAGKAPDNLKSLLGLFDRTDPIVTADLLEGVADDWPGVTRARAHEISVPTLVVGNDVDLVHPHAFAEEVAGAIPGAALVRAASKARDPAVHFADVRAAIGRFLDQIPPSDRSSPT